MSEFRHLDTEAPAEMGDVVEAVLRLSTLSEQQIVELVSDGQLGALFPFRPKEQDTPADFVDEAELQEASALPLRREQRASLIQSSMPASQSPRSRHSRVSEALAWQEKLLHSER